jgi:transglutaminase-like putative cysteine protease
MGEQARRSGLVALAIGLVGLAYLPLFSDRAWVAPTVLTVLLILGTGWALRTARASTALIILSQVLVLVMWASIRFADSTTFLNVVPTRATFTDLMSLGTNAVTSSLSSTVPTATTPGLILVTALGIGLVAFSVDAYALTLNFPALAGLPLLAMFLVPAVAIPGGTAWPFFAAAAVGFLVLLAYARADAVARWGTLREGQVVSPDGVLARRLGAIALGAAVLVPALVPLPGLTHSLFKGGPGAGASTVARQSPTPSIDPVINLAAFLNFPSNTPVFTYRTNAKDLPYFRLAVLNTTGGEVWTPTTSSSPIGPSGLPEGQATPTDQPATTRVVGSGEIGGLHEMPAPDLTTAVQTDQAGWYVDANNDTIEGASNNFTSQNYTVTSFDNSPSVAALVSTTQSPSVALSKDVRNAALLVPSDVSPAVATLARTITAGSPNELVTALRLQNYFLNNFTYDSNYHPTNTNDPLTDFLTAKRGYCQQFATTFATMARILGLPTRVVVGFTPGSLGSNSVWTVGVQDFHAWPEVYFPQAGWVRFEPTPRADGQLVLPSYAQLAAVNGQTTQIGESTLTKLAQADLKLQRDRRAEDINTADVTAPPVAPVPHAAGTKWEWVVGLLILLLITLTAIRPPLIRMWRRRRRLHAAAVAGSVEPSWSEVRDSAIDFGYAWSDADSPRVAAAKLRASLDDPVAMDRLAAAVERERYSTGAVSNVQTAHDVRTIRRGLADHQLPHVRLLAWLRPQSLRRPR